MQLMSQASLVFHLKNGPKCRSVIIVARKATFDPYADSINLKRQMELFPHRAQSNLENWLLMANQLSTSRNIETSSTRIQNSRLSSLHLLLSQLIILPTHKRCQMHWSTTTLKKEMNPMTMTSKLFGAWWVL